jgi:hypothetical protein
MFFLVGLFNFSPPFLTVGGERNANHNKIDSMIFSPMIETMGYLKPFAIFLIRSLLNLLKENLEFFKQFIPI